MSRGRDRKTQSMDKHDKHNEYEHNVDLKALEKFKKPEYPRYDVVGYMKAKGHNVKGVMTDGQADS